MNTETKSNNGRKSNMMPAAMAKSIVAANPELGVTATKLQEICEVMFTHVIEETKKDEKVNFPNFLKFERVPRNPRVFTNPKSGELINKPMRYTLVVSVMAALKKQFEEIPVVIHEDDEEEEVEEEEEDEEEFIEPEPEPKKKKEKVKEKKEVKEKKKEEEEEEEFFEPKPEPEPESKKKAKGKGKDKKEEKKEKEKEVEVVKLAKSKEVKEKKTKSKK